MMSCLLLLLGRFSYIARMGKRGGAVICLVSSCLLVRGGGGSFGASGEGLFEVIACFFVLECGII